MVWYNNYYQRIDCNASQECVCRSVNARGGGTMRVRGDQIKIAGDSGGVYRANTHVLSRRECGGSKISVILFA